MNGYYTGKIKVVGYDFMCFPVRASDLEPLSCGCYDPYALIDPDPEPLETISISEWNKRRVKLQHKLMMEPFSNHPTEFSHPLVL